MGLFSRRGGLGSLVGGATGGLGAVLGGGGGRGLGGGGGLVNALGTMGLGGFGAIGQNMFGMQNSDVLGMMGIGGNGGKAGMPPMVTRDYGPQIDEQQRRQAEIYQQQQGLAQALLAQSQGLGPNPAMNMLNQQTGQNVAQQGALMAGQRGVGANPALLARQIAMQGSGIQQQATGQAATMAAQQQIAAQQALMGQQATMSGNALQGEANQYGALGAQNNATIQGYLGAQDINQQETASKRRMMGGMMQAGGSMLAMSDERQKTNIQPANMGSFLDSLSPQSYEYKNTSLPGTAPGPRTGVMAQDLEQSGPGQSMVQNTPQGKMVDPGQGIGVALAALGDIHQRLKRIEGGAQNMAMGGSVQALPNFTANANLRPARRAEEGDEGGSNPFNMSGFMGQRGGGGGETMLPATGGMPGMMTANQGAIVPGQAQYPGDTERNDTVPAMLSPGEVVLPRSVTQSADPAAKAAEFMKHLKSQKKGYGGVIQARMACGGKVMKR